MADNTCSEVVQGGKKHSKWQPTCVVRQFRINTFKMADNTCHEVVQNKHIQDGRRHVSLGSFKCHHKSNFGSLFTVTFESCQPFFQQTPCTSWECSQYGGQNKKFSSGIRDQFSCNKNRIVLSSRLAAFQRACKGSIGVL